MKEEIERLIKKFEDSQVTTEHQIIKELKALIEPEKWEPKGGLLIIEPNGVITEEEEQPYGCVVYGNAWETVKLAGIARDMNKRNQLILQAKHEIGAEDGRFGLFIQHGYWVCGTVSPGNPELSFKERTQGEKVIEMLQLNANSS